LLADGVLEWHRAQAGEHINARRWPAAVFHLNRLIQAEPGKGGYYLSRGWAFYNQGKTAEGRQDYEKALSLKDTLSELEQAAAHGYLGHWEEAAALYARAVEAQDAAAGVWNVHALLRLHLGDREGYSRACATMLERFGKTKDAGIANSVAWTCALAPGAVADLEPAVQLARLAVQANPKDANILGTLGAVLHRAGQYEETVTQLNESVKLNDKDGTVYVGACDCLFLAMAHQHLGQKDEAKNWLDRAVQTMDSDPPVSWNHQLQLQLFRREAEQLIQEKPPD
jgi:tetratricopeptide (TPR) repeat protein